MNKIKYINQIITEMNRVIDELYSVEFVEPFVRKLILNQDSEYIITKEIREILIEKIKNKTICSEEINYLSFLTRDSVIKTVVEEELSKCENPFSSDAEFFSKILAAYDENWEDQEMYPLLVAEQKLMNNKDKE